jgi:hypothetical protein
LRPGGVFFVLDYKDEPEHELDVARAGPASSNTLVSEDTATSPSAATTAADPPSSPASCSRAVKEIPQELLQQWNLTMVPTNLEMYYHQKYGTAAPNGGKNTSLPAASQRIVRWMGIKPNALTTATRGPQAN